MLDDIEARMRPGGWNPKPMLRPGDVLASVLASDERELGALGVSHRALGARLAELIARGGDTDWFRPFRAEGFDVELRRRRGFLTCPWAAAEFAPCTAGEGGRATANEFLVRNRQRGATVLGFEISVHLIRDHGFFGGPGTAFRIEPRTLAYVLGAVPR